MEIEVCLRAMFDRMADYRKEFENYIKEAGHRPLFLCGDALTVLRVLPDESIDCCMTSPPYWNKREYASGGNGLEIDYQRYAGNLLVIFIEVKRVLKSSGSFWLNLGDSYQDKGLIGIPWRVALAMIDDQGWILRNDIVWNKIKGPDNSKDKLRNTHENVFHFVKQRNGFYYDIDSIRSKPREAKIKNGAVVSATVAYFM